MRELTANVACNYSGESFGFDQEGFRQGPALYIVAHLPPVTSRNVPVTKDASALASHRIARATSSG